MGSISKQGNSFLRQLLVEAAQTANRLDEGFRRQYQARATISRKAWPRWQRRGSW
ncbi:MAG: transposase [Acidobacteriaceae bacterium]